jgi:hypothetical protein
VNQSTISEVTYSTDIPNNKSDGSEGITAVRLGLFNFTLLTGEFERKRMLDHIGLSFWWTSIYKNVKEYVFECDAFQRRSGKREFKAPLGSVTERT